jgi:hypothetical protein
LNISHILEDIIKFLAAQDDDGQETRGSVWNVVGFMDRVNRRESFDKSTLLIPSTANTIKNVS